MRGVLTSFCSYMRFAHRHGPRTRWRDEQGRWHVRGRVERFLEPALLLLLAERPAHGYELVDRAAELVPGERPELGGLYRVLRAWAKALKQTQVVVDAFLQRFEGR